MSEEETQNETEEGSGAVEEVEETVEGTVEEVEETVEETLDEVEETVEEGLDLVNDGLVDVVSAVLDTRIRAEVYVALRKLGEAGVDEVVEETGLYPKKVENTLEGLVEDEVVESVEVGDEEVYTAVSPSNLVIEFPERLADSVRDFVESVEEDLEGDGEGSSLLNADWSPYRIIVGTDEEEESEEAEIAVQG